MKRIKTVPGVSIVLIFLCLTMVPHLCYGKKLSSGEIDRQISEIEETYGITVHYDIKKMEFPSNWYARGVRTKVEPISSRKLPDTLKVIKSFLSKYPKEIVKKHLSGIVVTGKMVLRSKVYGGTYDNSTIYIATEGANHTFGNKAILGTMAHEFSSILMKSHDFPSREWGEINPHGFEYDGGSGYEFLGKKRAPKSKSWIYSQGFVNEYAQTNMENDFNELSELLFSKRSELNSLCKKYKRIMEKRDLAIKFYKSIDQNFKF